MPLNNSVNSLATKVVNCVSFIDGWQFISQLFGQPQPLEGHRLSPDRPVVFLLANALADRVPSFVQINVVPAKRLNFWIFRRFRNLFGSHTAEKSKCQWRYDRFGHIVFKRTGHQVEHRFVGEDSNVPGRGADRFKARADIGLGPPLPEANAPKARKYHGNLSWCSDSTFFSFLSLPSFAFHPPVHRTFLPKLPNR